MYLVILVLFMAVFTVIGYDLTRVKKMDIYLFPSSIQSIKQYGPHFTKILSNYGNIKRVSWPHKQFNMEKFAESISNTIVKRGKPAILVGNSLGSFLANVVAVKIQQGGRAHLLRSVLCISYSCTGKLTKQGLSLNKKLGAAAKADERDALMNKILYSSDDRVPNEIRKLQEASMLRPDVIGYIVKSIGRLVASGVTFCEPIDAPVHIIYGEEDIEYGKPSEEICTLYSCTQINKAGHDILAAHYNEVCKWLRNILDKIQ